MISCVLKFSDSAELVDVNADPMTNLPANPI